MLMPSMHFSNCAPNCIQNTKYFNKRCKKIMLNKQWCYGYHVTSFQNLQNTVWKRQPH